MDDLREMKISITDYTQTPELADAITRYHTLLQITFSSNLYKLYETPDSQITKMLMPMVPGAAPTAGAPGPGQNLQPENAEIELTSARGVGRL